MDWSDEHYYDGPAIKVGAGVLGYEAIEAAYDNNLVLVTGECPTVGLAGGYTQGGGHSALSTSFGLAADQTLEFEVVVASGEVVKASRTENSDLYWALSGGGGGTYGVVTSLTVRAHPEATIGGASLQMAAAYTTEDNFYEAVSAFHDMLPAMTDQGAMVVYYVSNAVFVINPITVYNSTAAYVRDVVLAPFTAKLAELGIPATVKYSELSYRDHYDTYMGPLPNGHVAVEYQFGSRLIPRHLLESDNPSFQAALRNLTTHGVLAVGSAADYSVTNRNNAVHPAWKTTTVHLQLTTPWDSAPNAWSTMVNSQEQMTREFVPQLVDVAPESGAYFNEGDFREPNWQQTFFGSNYQALLEVKQKWDPESVFYVLKGVGSDAWTVAEDGRMCRA